ncbi:MAG TPA: PQQ-dependent sugar dehydrogenase [Methylomirabilota bacterium]|nr:PQQ-dependent sugar dehydrogenase [Methylomirabilota bacterium]
MRAWAIGLPWALAMMAQGLAVAATDRWLKEWELPEGFSLTIDAEGFHLPSAIAVVPNPGPHPKDPLYFVTELRGKIKVVANDRSIHTFAEDFFELVPFRELPATEGEVGLAGIALDPAHGYVFVSFAYQDTNKVLRNNIVRFDTRPGTFALQPTGSVSFADIFDADLSRLSHQIGGMVVDGPTLYVSVGDGGQPFNSQSPYYTTGKILRMTLDGRPLPDNPFRVDDDLNQPANFVWALGLRNPFGLAMAHGRLFTAENGLHIDRFLEIRRGDNGGWDGHNWSIGMNSAMVFGPTVSPVQLAWLGPDQAVFPPEYRSKFYVAMAGDKGDAQGVVMLDYDFERGRMADRPRQFLWLRPLSERRRESPLARFQVPVGLAFGRDALYVVPLYPVRHDRQARGAVLRIAFEPARAHPHVLGRNETGYGIMVRMGCFGCHGQRITDKFLAPSLDKETLIPRILAQLDSPAYRRMLAEVDALGDELHQAHRTARREVMAAEGMERARLWIKHRVMEPLFDRTATAMPKLGLGEKEAQEIADYLIQQNVGAVDTGWAARLRQRLEPLIAGRSRRGLALMSFGAGAVCTAGAVGVWFVGGRWRRRRRALGGGR